MTPFIKNVGAGGGIFARSRLHQRKGDSHRPHMGSSRIYVKRIVGTTPFK